MSTFNADVRGRLLAKQGLDNKKLIEAEARISALEESSVLRLRALFRTQPTWSPDTPYPQQPIYLGTSGGKDSVAIYYLVQQAFPENTFPVVHTPKVNETHPDTISFLYGRPHPILYIPAKDMNRCAPQLRVQIDGTRRSEHSREDGRSTNVIVDGLRVSRENMPFFIPRGLFGLSFIFPIYDWTDEEVWAYILQRNIPFTWEYLR